MCANSENVEGQIPLVVLDMHLSKAPVNGPVFAADSARVGRYYAQPPIWHSVQTAMEKLIKASPDNTFLRTAYARIASLAGKFEVAHEQFVKLAGKYDPRFFPEPREYERFVEVARNAVGMKK